MYQTEQLQECEPPVWVVEKINCITEIESKIKNDKKVMELWKKMKDYHETTYRHGINVCRDLIKLGVYREYPTEKTTKIAIAGLLLDIGYLKVPRKYLNSCNGLRPNQFAVIKKHPEYGAMLAREYGFSEEIQNNILTHHESPDGTGYPNKRNISQLTTDQLIIRIVDMYQAMQEDRIYREGKPEYVAYDQILYMSTEKEEFEAIVDLKIAQVLFSA